MTLIGVSGAGKSTLAGRHFQPSEVVSSDHCRWLVSDDAADQSATPDAFSLLHHIVDLRLHRGRLTVVDATNLAPGDRQPLLELAEARYVPAVAVVLDVPLELCVERNHRREGPEVPLDVLRDQGERVARVTDEQLFSEGFAQVVRLSVDDVHEASVARMRRVGDLSEWTGPFDVIGDVHGCLDELVALLTTLGYDVAPDRSGARHPEGRMAVFVGDLVDRGPSTPGVLRLVMGMARDGCALCVPGNHEARLLMALRGQEVPPGHGLAEALEQLAGESDEMTRTIAAFIEGLPSHLVLDGGQLVVAHAGMPETMQNRDATAVRRFALYGDTTGETDEMGMPVRYPWARDYRGTASVVYGHTPVTTPTWDNGTICLDTGCVYGGALTGLRYPECEVVSVPAARTHYAPRRQFTPVAPSAPSAAAVPGSGNGSTAPADLIPGATLLNGSGQAPVSTSNGGGAGAAAHADGSEPGSAIGAAPHPPHPPGPPPAGSSTSPWLVYVPPAVPPGPAGAKGVPEHPAAAFMVYAEAGVTEAVCEYVHTGVRAVMVLCRDADAAAARFGAEGTIGGFYGEDGAPLLDDVVAPAALEGMYAAVTQVGLWSELDTSWLVVEVVVLPDGRMAPVTMLAGSSGVWARHDRRWHLSVAERLSTAAPGWVSASRSTEVRLDDVLSRAEAIAWWQDVTSAGGAGMVVRPAALSGLADDMPPAMLCRRRAQSSEEAENDPRVAQDTEADGLVRWHVRAARAAGLGEDGLRRLVAGEPLERVRACCREVLALERGEQLPVAGA